MPTLEQLTNATRQLHQLLDDPHPGLFTWVEAVNEAVQQLRRITEPDARSLNHSSNDWWHVPGAHPEA